MEDKAREILESAMTPFLASSIQMHQMFKDYVSSGFTEDQALSLIAKILAEMGKGQRDNPS